jgi:hypothetical protein
MRRPTWKVCGSPPGRVVAGQTESTAPVGPLLFSENGIADGGDAPYTAWKWFQNLRSRSRARRSLMKKRSIFNNM